jgi:oligopeptidase B
MLSCVNRIRGGAETSSPFSKKLSFLQSSKSMNEIHYSPRVSNVISSPQVTPVRKTVLSPSREVTSTKEISDIIGQINDDPLTLPLYLNDVKEFLAEACAYNPINSVSIWNTIGPLLNNLQTQFSQPITAIKNVMKSPRCAKKPVTSVNMHGDSITDDYVWLKERENSEVQEYIKEENEYTEKMMEYTKPLQKTLYLEFVSRLDENEESTHVRYPDGWTYYSRRVSGDEYLLHCRLNAEGAEEVYLNENDLAWSKEFENSAFFKVTFLKLSPDCLTLAYGIDTSGNERNTVYFINMVTNTLIDEHVYNVYEDLEFSNDGSCVYYTELDKSERAFKFRRHILGQKDSSKDEVLYHEKDDMFFLTAKKTCDGQYIILMSTAQVTAEGHYISTQTPDSKLYMLTPRVDRIRYTCEHHGSHFYILTNENGINNWMFRIPDTLAGENVEDFESIRETVIEHRDFVLVEGNLYVIVAFEFRINYMIVQERSNCRQNLRIIKVGEGVSNFNTYHYVGFSELVYSIWLGTVDWAVPYLSRHHYDTDVLRFYYTSFVHPIQVIDYDMNTRISIVTHEERVPGDSPYDSSIYESKRLYATSYDGTAVPISIIYKKDLLGMKMEPKQINPTVLHAYGAYGTCVNPIFSTSRLSLLDRGFIYAVVHIRGGADMGNAWSS